jgi:nucleoside-diphosphate-sugar epimerase
MLNQKTILITGIAGFFGRYLTQVYLENNYHVIGFDVRKTDFSHANLTHITGDLSETEKLLTCLRLYKPPYFIHLAGLIKSKSVKLLFETNVHGLYSVCEAIRLSDLKPRLALISSSAVYDSSCEKIPEQYKRLPITDYGLTKKIQEDIVINYSQRGFLTHKIFRPFNLVGYGMPQELAIASFIDRLQVAKQMGSRSIEVGNLTSTRDYLDIRDAANVVFKLFDDVNSDFEVINVCSGVGYQMTDLLKICCDILGFYPNIRVNNDYIQNNDNAYQVGSAQKLCQYYDMTKFHSIQSSLLTMMKTKLY